MRESVFKSPQPSVNFMSSGLLGSRDPDSRRETTWQPSCSNSLSIRNLHPYFAEKSGCEMFGGPIILNGIDESLPFYRFSVEDEGWSFQISQKWPTWILSKFVRFNRKFYRGEYTEGNRKRAFLEEGRRLQGGDPEADVWSHMKIDLPFKCDSDYTCAPFANEAVKINGCLILNLELRRHVRIFKPKGVLKFRNLDADDVSSKK